jgi:hypothetical protein
LEIVEMFEIYLALSDDRTEASIQLPSMGGPQKMSADELFQLIRHLTQLRADMSLAHEHDPTPKIQTAGTSEPEPPASSAAAAISLSKWPNDVSRAIPDLRLS